MLSGPNGCIENGSLSLSKPWQLTQPALLRSASVCFWPESNDPFGITFSAGLAGAACFVAAGAPARRILRYSGRWAATAGNGDKRDGHE